ncbi:MAG: hypothetical protein IT179_15985 [Acidobacteria bacterium]|nr:hypothetical protein [Acidobacteriota bacterium]
MKRLAVVAAAVVLANVVDINQGVVLPAAAQDQAAQVVAEVKKALGGDTLDAVKALTAEGPFRRTMGQRDMEGTLILTLVRPDKFKRSEEMGMGGMVGGPTVERISAFNGTEAWDDIQNRGGMGGGMRMMMRGPGDGPGGPGGPGGSPLTPEQIAQQRVRRMKMELQRWTVALFAESAQPFTHGGVAESPEGKADILETKDEAGRALRLFVDQSTHLPLMVQYMEIRPRVVMRGGPGGRPGAGGQPPSEAEMRQRMEEIRKQGPPQPSQFAMHLGDYKKVNGVMLPHRIGVSIEGQPNEEWTVEKYKVNPSVKDSEFEKPKA